VPEKCEIFTKEPIELYWKFPKVVLNPVRLPQLVKSMLRTNEID